jgi:hypothetical protein
LTVPVHAREEVDEVDAQGLFGLPDLPVLHTAGALEILTETAALVRQRHCRRRAHQELARAAGDLGGVRVANQPVFQQVLAELLQCRLGLAHLPSYVAEWQVSRQCGRCARILL